MTLDEALDEIRRRDDIIASHKAIEEEYRRQIAKVTFHRETLYAALRLIAFEHPAMRAWKG